MITDSSDLDGLLERVQRGDQQALVALFTRYRDRLRRLVRLRLDRRLQGRIDPSDVLQDAYLDVARRAANTSRTRRSLSSCGSGWSPASGSWRCTGSTWEPRCGMRAGRLLGVPCRVGDVGLAGLCCSWDGSRPPRRGAQRAEMQIRLQEVINAMDPIDREVPDAAALRGAEQRRDGPRVPGGYQKAAASNRYLRCLKRLKDTLASMPGFFDN